MVPAAEATANLRQRPPGEHLGEVVADLPGPNDIRRSPRRQNVVNGDSVIFRDDMLDIRDLQPLVTRANKNVGAVLRVVVANEGHDIAALHDINASIRWRGSIFRIANCR